MVQAILISIRVHNCFYFSNPTPGISKVKWPRYKTASKDFLNLDETSTAGKFSERNRVEFWDKIYCEVGLPCIGQSNLQLFLKV